MYFESPAIFEARSALINSGRAVLDLALGPLNKLR